MLWLLYCFSFQSRTYPPALTRNAATDAAATSAIRRTVGTSARWGRIVEGVGRGASVRFSLRDLTLSTHHFNVPKSLHHRDLTTFVRLMQHLKIHQKSRTGALTRKHGNPTWGNANYWHNLGPKFLREHRQSPQIAS